jgi:hypothetical protein
MKARRMRSSSPNPARCATSTTPPNSLLSSSSRAVCASTPLAGTQSAEWRACCGICLHILQAQRTKQRACRSISLPTAFHLAWMVRDLAWLLRRRR